MGKCQRMLQLSQKSSNTPWIAWSCNLELADQPLWWDSKDILPLLAGEQVHQSSSKWTVHLDRRHRRQYWMFILRISRSFPHLKETVLAWVLVIETHVLLFL